MLKGRARKAEIGDKRHHGYQMGRKQLPPLPENYFGSQIDEVSSVRDSVIENESQIN